MDNFVQLQSIKKKRNNQQKMIGNVTQTDLDTLQLILVGLNYLKFHLLVAPLDSFTAAFKKNSPNMVFYKSKFSKRTMAAGIKTVKEKTGVINWVYDYSEVPKTLSESYPVQVNYSPSNDT